MFQISFQASFPYARNGSQTGEDLEISDTKMMGVRRVISKLAIFDELNVVSSEESAFVSLHQIMHDGQGGTNNLNPTTHT